MPFVAAVLVTMWSTPGRAVTAPSASEGVPAFGHVFVVIGENTELGQVNKTNAPFIMGTVKPQAAWLTNYFAVTHFSEANYAAMTSGQFTHCQQFDGAIASCHQDVPNIFHQLDGVGVSWQSWMESMPNPCQVVSAGGAKTQNHYAPKHNPAVFYDNVEGKGGVWSADPNGQSDECKANDIATGGTGPNDMSTFNSALQAGHVGRFNYIVPNECEDGHDNCQPQGNGVTQFDNFLAQEVPKIMNSSAFGSDGVLIITYDEGTSNKGPGSSKQFAGGGNVIFAVLGPLARPGEYGSNYNHYSLLRTWEDGFGITEHPANAAGATPINTIWK
ncbi:MAG: alkaline phosphatase family protein [Nocardioidaceae bacterium]